MIFLSGEKFCDILNSGQQFDIVLMDIEMEGITGIEAGKMLRESILNGFTLLIFVSSYRQYCESLLDLETFCFINKPIDENNFNKKIVAAIDKVLQLRQMPKGPVLMVKQGKGEACIPTGEIMYIESRNRRLHIQTINISYEYYGNLDAEIKKLLATNFVRIHKSYIINFDFIRLITTKSVTIADGRTFAISRQYCQNVKDSYLRYSGMAR